MYDNCSWTATATKQVLKLLDKNMQQEQHEVFAVTYSTFKYICLHTFA